ncbi:signal transduction histidine kinase [Nitzschia inconspicua]|uniref:histidine kinase n=1 Tax=Nitzschia inconspicua TaxID=303405 RepID=A0A9K3L435_9STRA|nr:signal transduction histidine kinase [Nitzschia inconspicua]
MSTVAKAKQSIDAYSQEIVDMESQSHRCQDGPIQNGNNVEGAPAAKQRFASKQRKLQFSGIGDGMNHDTSGACNGPRPKNVHDNNGDSPSVSSESSSGRGSFPIWVTITLIITLGAATCAAFLAVGITAANKDQSEQFHRLASDLTNQIQQAWEDYVAAAAWIHGRCRDRNFSRADFLQTYEYLNNSGLDFQAAQFDPNITRDEREAAEAEARAFYARHHPQVNYTGFMGFETANSTVVEPRSQQDFYFPIHYMEPIKGNERAIDLDYHASGSRRRTVLYCMNEGKPALTDRLRLVQEKYETFGVVLMHPGFNLSEDMAKLRAAEAEESQQGLDGGIGVEQLEVAAHIQPWPRDLASIVIRIPDLILRAAKRRGDPSIVYLYDKSDSSGSPLFLGAAQIIPQGDTIATLQGLPETTLDRLHNQVAIAGSLFREEIVNVANKEWIVFVHSVEGTYQPNNVFVVLGGIVIFLASIALGIWLYTNQRRLVSYNKERMKAEAERAALILDSARQATKAERELNDFIAHEVRNPVSAAMSACTFVKTALEGDEPLRTEEQREETREDVAIIDSALRFVNDLLRNMLDMHRATNKQLKVNMTPTDVQLDVLESVHAMLPQRDPKFTVQVDCPDGLVVMTDRLRLKQVCLNLARNSVKFISEGFIRLRAEVINNEVHIYLEDSGPGIPDSKKDMLFSKFQESLDSLSQGTGIGLFLCKNLVALMDGEIYLDEDYDSGVPGNPGTRFVVNLKQPPIDPKIIHDSNTHHTIRDGTGETVPLSDDEESIPHELPADLYLLFVDDDPILRKLFTRSIRTFFPNWRIREASNGETALRLIETESFDLIFMDMYMASVEKQLLGTEAVRELRRRGVECRICGLSANDKELEFLQAGADCFSFKPFPCEPITLKQELCRILYSETPTESSASCQEG